jgi:hypothetical protein
MAEKTWQQVFQQQPATISLLPAEQQQAIQFGPSCLVAPSCIAARVGIPAAADRTHATIGMDESMAF